MEGWSYSVTKGNSDATKLVSPLSKRVAGRVRGLLKQVEAFLIKLTEVHWLNKVHDQWEKFLFRTGNNWKCSFVPEEADAMLVDGDNLDQVGAMKKWIKLSKSGEAWGM